MRNRPSWYTNEHDSAWDRVKSAFRNDWEQTRHDFGSDRARDLDQDVDNTVKQMAGSEGTFDSHEEAFRYGHAARRSFGARVRELERRPRDASPRRLRHRLGTRSRFHPLRLRVPLPHDDRHDGPYGNTPEPLTR